MNLCSHYESEPCPSIRCKPILRKSLLVPAFFLCVVRTAVAQDINLIFSPGLDPQTTQIMSQIRENHAWAESAYGRPARSAASTAPSGAVSAQAAPAALTYPEDPAVSLQVKNATIAQWKRNNPGKDAAIDALFSRHDFLAAFRDLTAPYGIDSHNLGDVAAAWLVVSWALLHGVETIDKPSVTAVRRQIGESLASSAKVRGLDAAQKQSLGEMLIYQTVLLQANRVQLAKTGSSALRQRAVDPLNRSLLETGIDLQRMSLTARGFVTGQP